VVEPETKWWAAYNLGSPETVIKVFVNQSKCFTLVDRGKGMAAAQAERALASSGELRGRSNVGKGQVKAADYVMVPDLVSSNKNSGGNAIGGLLGGLIGGGAGAVLGGINLKKKSADVVLTVTDVRSSEQVAMIEGHTSKTDLGWGAGGGVFGGGALVAGGASGYSDTEIGKVITLAYLDAYIKLVESTSAAQSYCLRCHSTPISASVTMPSNLTNMRVSWNTDFHGAGKGSGYGGTLKAPYSRGQAAIDCDVCHDAAAHGSATNPYKLKTTVNGNAVSVTNGTSAATLCAACHEGTPNDFHAQCISCHQSFVPDYHNDTGNAPKDFIGADCLSCHEHGKTGYAPGCHSCHNYPGAGPYTTF